METIKTPQLRYQLVCSIGSVPGAEHMTGDRGYTDDLELALWESEHSGAPYWDVYDVIDKKYVGGASEPPPESCDRMAIERFITQFTAPWSMWQEGHDDRGQIKSEEEWVAKYPAWRAAPEQIVAPLRVALYASMAIERAASERPRPVGRMASYSDGRDLLEGWDDLSFNERSTLAWKSYDVVLRKLGLA